MYHERLITAVAATLGAIAVVLTVVGVTGTPVALPVALAFAASAVLMYDQLSGRMAARVYRRVEQHARVTDRASGDGGRRGRRRNRRSRRQGRQRRGGTGAGPREEWTPPRDGATMGEAAAGGRRRSSRAGASARAGGAGATGRNRRTAGATARADDRLSAAEAYRKLGLEPGADEDSIKQAYRQKVKEVHPDTSGGDEAEFMAVKAAYERLTD